MADFVGSPEEQTDKQAEADAKRTKEAMPGLAGLIWERFYEAEHARYGHEARWLAAYKDFRGVYDSSVQFRETEKSRVFVKIPKTKTLAAYGQIIEVLFANKKFPLLVKPTEKPTGIAEKAHYDPKNATPQGAGQQPEIPKELDVGYPGDGRKNAADPVIGGLSTEYENAQFQPGEARLPTQIEISPAKEAAANMNKTIQDQLTETHAARTVRQSVFEQCLYGTGVIKGPFNYEKTIHRWNIETPEDIEDHERKKIYSPDTVEVPRLSHVSIWDFYPDPNAACLDDCEYVIERHKLGKSQLRKLLKRPFFNKAAIRTCLAKPYDYVSRGYEDQLTNNGTKAFDKNRYEVLEYWGCLDIDTAIAAGFDASKEDYDELEEVQMNVWICGDQILRIVLNPFEPERIPYHVVPYEENPHEIFGIGVPENMKDSTMIMNGHARMAIDNLALSGNLILDVDEQALVDGQSFDLYGGKIFRRQSGQPGQAIYPIKFQNTTAENMQMFDRFRQLADEQTGIPSYSHGTTGVQSTTRTAAGMSMLMGAAALSIKTVVKNIDDFLLKPLGEAFFHWNMQFNDDVTIVGDVDIKALGTDAVMQKEVRSQRLTQFLQVVANPIMGSFANLPYIMKELAISLDLDPHEIVNDPEEAKLFAAILGEANKGGAPMTSSGAGMDTSSTGTGNATIGVGGAPQPSEPGFSANAG